MVKRYYPIVESLDDLKGIEVEGPLGNVSVCLDSKKMTSERGETERSAREQIQGKLNNDDRFVDDDVLLLIKKSGWRKYGLWNDYHGEYSIVCDVYRIKR